MDDLDTFTRKRQFGLRDRGARGEFKLLSRSGEPVSREPVGGNSNPGASLADIYEMRYINNDEIPPRVDNLHKLDSLRFLRKSKKSRKTKRAIKKCKCKK
jgi:hypothetical protein